MDKETLSNYGWIVICVLVLAVMIALATPFGNFISDAIWSTANGLFNTNNNALDNTLEDLGVVPTPEQLQARYKFEYYGTLNGAVNDVNNGTIGTNADANKEDAVAGVYTNEGQTYVVLLKDSTEATRIKPSVDMTINLGGHTFTCNNGAAIAPQSGRVVIDGRLNGSTVRGESSANFNLIQPEYTSNVEIIGGRYIATTTSTANHTVSCINAWDTSRVEVRDATIISTATATGRTRGIVAQSGTSVTISNCSISALSEVQSTGVASTNAEVTVSNCNISATARVGDASGIFIDGNATISNCNINAATKNGHAWGIFNDGTATISNCDIRAYSDYFSDGDGYSALSTGVSNEGTLTINNCYVMGTHSGLSNDGTLHVNGGTYEGYGHGGFYFAGTRTTAYVRNAIIRECAMPDGYTATSSDNNSGFYVGGATGNDNISVYLDNCDITGGNPFTMRGTSGEMNNKVYISNSNIYGGKIRLDGGNHTIYIGAGNNFTEDNVSFTDREIDKPNPSHVEITDETYIQK